MRNILLPTDGSSFSEAAIPYALDIASEFDSEIVFLQIVSSRLMDIDTKKGSQSKSLVDEADVHLRSKQVSLRQQGYKVRYRILAGNQIADTIVTEADRLNSDLIIMATHGRGGIKRWILGSVAEKVLHQAPCPVLLVRGGVEKFTDWQFE